MSRLQDAVDRRGAQGSRRRGRRLGRRRRPAQPDAQRRAPQDHPEAARRARRASRRRRRPAAASGRRRSPASRSTSSRCRTCRSRRAPAARSTSTRSSAPTPPRSPSGRRSSPPSCALSPVLREVESRDAGRRACARASTSTARWPGGSASPCRRSTMRSTTPSASGRSRPSTPRPTSIASCSRRCRSTAAIPRSSTRLYIPSTNGAQVPLTAIAKIDRHDGAAWPSATRTSSRPRPSASTWCPARR